MKSLSKNAFERAAEFIASNARPLERAQFDFHFGSGSVEDVLTELAKFQNDDGGFGHGVEPDVGMPNSSPFVSSVAFQILAELDVPAEHSIVRDGIAYFERSYDDSIDGWDPTGPAVDDHPRAPWWNYSAVEGRLDAIKRSNPGAEIVGYLHRYGEVSNGDFVRTMTQDALRTFEELPDDMEVHSMMCFMRLAELGPSGVTEQLLPKLQRGVHLVVGTSATEWAVYGGRPLWLAGSPDSLLANELGESIPIQLDYEIDSQSEDGSWMPNWAWGQYEDVWEQAKLEWAGYLTLRNLMALKAWSRL